VCFEAWYRVERRASLAHDGCAGYVSRPTRRCDVFLTPTRLTEPSEETQAAAWQIAAEGGSLAEQAELAHEWTGSTLAYKFGVTGVHTTATEALRLGQGVCQDYAHILLTLLRQLSIPARYVSGLLPGSGAPHAWVEALLPLDGRPGRRWVPFDPTNQKRPDLQYLAIAVGRDFNDITITSGVYAGAASGTLTCTNQTSVVEIEELPGRAL
jgi:transglutaminase-like putative cysteine protease